MNRRPSTFGPPAEDLFAQQTDLPSVEATLRGALKRWAPVPPPPHAEAAYEGTLEFDHLVLVGPPVRLQGGFHAIGRLQMLLDRVAEHDAAATFPAAAALELLAPVDLFQPVDVTAHYGRQPSGRWWLSSRLGGHERLRGVAWGLRAGDPLLDVDLPAWRARWQQSQASAATLPVLSQPYRASDDLFWTEFDYCALRKAAPGFRRFETDDGRLGLALLSYQLDNVGILAHATRIGNPCFTSRLKLVWTAPDLDPDEPLLLLVDRTAIVPEPHPVAPALRRGNELLRPQISEVVAVDRDFSRLVARAWVHLHPVDIERLMRRMSAG